MGKNNIEIAAKTMKITAARKYEVSGRVVRLPELDFAETIVCSPENGEKLLLEPAPKKNGKLCRIIVTTEDSFRAASRYYNPLVMNFANAFVPGGGFRLGARAQEEALCRCSTLYSSLNCEAAAAMYNFNAAYRSEGESDYMLLTPNVCVFRNENLDLLEAPFVVAVATVPAPNRFGESMFYTEKKVADIMTNRIRIMLRLAAKHGYKNIVAGAWGCGAFGNAPADVAAQFGTALTDDGLGRCFERVVFAVYGKPDGRNITAFKEHFLK